LVLFFRKEQESSFSEEKEAKRLLIPGAVRGNASSDQAEQAS
jgi:hypothetical protein